MLRRLTRKEVSLEILRYGVDVVARSRLVFANGDMSADLAGCVLEACYAWREGHLVLLTQNVPFEETLMIYLLDGKGAVLDRAQLSALYTAGGVRDLREEGENSILFSFFHADEWEVKLYESPRRCWPKPVLFQLFQLVKRPFQFRRYFDLIMRIAPSEHEDAV